MFRKWEKEGAAPQKIGNAGQGCSEVAYTCPLGTAFLLHDPFTLLPGKLQSASLQLRMGRPTEKLGRPLELCVWSVLGQLKIFFLDWLLEGQWTLSLEGCLEPPMPGSRFPATRAAA